MAAIFATSAFVGGCGASAGGSDEGTATGGEDAITSTDGTPLELRFDAEVVAAEGTPAKTAVLAQLEYLQGILTTGPGGNAQFRFSDMQNARKTIEGTKVRWSYSVSVTALYPAGRRIPRTLNLALPLDVTALAAFNAKYDGPCGTNEYGQDTFWHDFNPGASGCTLDDGDVHRTTASVRPHPRATTDKYPEYDKMWSDGVLKIVAVYGAISNTLDSDSGATDREKFLAKVQRSLASASRTDEEPRGGILKESKVTGEATLDGRAQRVELIAYFVDEVRSAGRTFDERYRAATESADIVLYSGHSGLGKNIAHVAKETQAKKGQYQLVFLNGCQTFGYLGPAMHEARIATHGAEDDPNGTKYLDVILTALPAYAESTPTEQLLFDAALERTKGYTTLLREFSREQSPKHLTLVYGEDDNTFTPPSR